MIKQHLFTPLLAIGLSAWIIFSYSSAAAQIATGNLSDPGDEGAAEELFSNEDSPRDQGDDARDDSGSANQSQPAASDLKEVADLRKLEPFSDIAVIQKRFLPKTGRFELFGGPTAILNDAFFLNFGGNVRMAYFFRERYALELNAIALAVTERGVTTSLREDRGVNTRNFVTPKTYIGADFRWSPVYGKMTWLNERITPFDLYFSLGGGLTSTTLNESNPTLHLGTGQVFAMTKALAWRWDFSWNFFAAKSSVDPSGPKSYYNNLFLTVGLSFFFPEATYR